MSQADTQLWNGWRRQRDEQAFEALVRPHLRFAFDFARRLGCRPDEADDVVQESLTRLAAERSEKPVRVGMRAWLGRSVALQTKMLRRSEGRRSRREQAYAPPPSEPSATPGRSDEVEAAVQALPPGQREAVILRYRHDLEYAEIARILDISENAARLRVHKAMNELRRRLGGNAGPMVAVLPLLGGTGRAEVVQGAVTASAATSATGFFLGAFLMKHIVATSVAAVAVGAALFFALQDNNSNADTASTEPPAHESAVADADGEAPSLAPGTPRQEQPDTGTRKRTPPASDPAPQGTIAELLAKGARVCFATRADLTGSHHRGVRWYYKGDEIPEGAVRRPAAASDHGRARPRDHRV